MDLIADILLISGAVAAAFYCIILARRLRRFTDLEKGVGGAIAVLSTQVDDMTKTIEAAQIQANDSAETLLALTERANDVARRLELFVASLHDLPGVVVDSEKPKDKPVFDSGRAQSASEKPKPETQPEQSEPLSLFRSARRSQSQVAA